MIRIVFGAPFVPRLLVAGGCVVALSLAGAADSPQSRAQAAPPNILLIQADDLGYGDLSAFGQARFETPSLDRLAREGIRFNQYYAGSTVCAPSRTALMTGLHTGHAPIRGNRQGIALGPDDVTIATLLRRAGYRTAVIGKWGLGSPGSTGQPDRQGFEYSFGFLDHTHAHAKLLDCTPVGVFYGQSLRFVHRSKSLQMDLARDHEIVDHVAREPPVAAPPDGVQTATHTDERAQAAFALPDLFLPAPISTAAAANCRSRRICIEQLARNAPDLRIGETAHDSLN